MVDVSIILVNYNTCKLTCNAIQSIYNFTKELQIEVILVDNNSKDDSVVVIKNKFPKVRIIENKQNIGFGRANNKGIKIAKGKYLFLLNTDAYLKNNAIEILCNFMEKDENKNVSVAGAKLLTPDFSFNVSAGNFPNFKLFIKGSFWKLFYSKQYYSNAYRRKIPSTSITPFIVDYVSGADFFVRKSIIDEVGGFDKRFFMYGEDTELSYRIKKNFPKMESMIVPEAEIIHISQGSSNEDNQSKRFKLKLIKGRTLYYRITEGFLPSILYYITSIKRLYF